MLFSGKWFDPVVGIDIHLIQPPGPVPPVPVPHPFIGIVYDPAGLLVGMAINAAMSGLFGGSFSGPVLINGVPAANTGTQVKGMPVHVPIGGVFVNPPSNEGTIITGSKTVHVLGTSGARLTSMVITCNDPINLPTSVVMSIPMGPPVCTGGPTAVDWLAVVLSAIRTKWVSDKLHGIFKAKPGSWRSKIICFLTGHPVDVATGRVLTAHTDSEMPGSIPFRFERNYCNASTYDGPLGIGWHHSYDQHITVQSDRILYRSEDGREIEFDYIETGESVFEPVERLELTRRENELRLRTKDRRTLCFRSVAGDPRVYHLILIEDLNGNSISLDYREGRLVSIIDSVKRKVTLTYNHAGRLTSVNIPDPKGSPGLTPAARFEYDELADLTAVYDAVGQAFRYAYKNHILVQETNRNGLSFYFEYDVCEPWGWCTRTWGDAGIYDHKLTYHRAAQITVVENSLGARATYFWNDLGLVTKIVDALGGQRNIQWDQFCRKVAETDRNGGRVEWKYDEKGRLVCFKNETGDTVSTEYDECGNPVSIKFSNGAMFRFGFDNYGNVTSSENALRGRYLYSYSPNRRAVTCTTPQGETAHLIYDEGGQLCEARVPGRGTHRLEYTARGEIAAYISPGGLRHEYLYDLNGRLALIRYPDGTHVRYGYDPEGNVTRKLDSRGYVTQYRYGGFNKLLERIEPSGCRFCYEYDSEGHLIALENQRGERHELVLDDLGRVSEERTFDGVGRRYRYDGSERPTSIEEMSSQCLPDGSPAETRLIRFKRDAAGNVLVITLPCGEGRRFEYEAFGRLKKAQAPRHCVTLQYNSAGQVIRDEQDGRVIRYDYDASGRRIRRDSPFGPVVQYSYLFWGSPSGITVQGVDSRPLTIQFGYNPDGQIEEINYPGFVNTSCKYDAGGRLASLRHATLSHTTNLLYSYDDAGRISELQDVSYGGESFSYDPLGRLSAFNMDNRASERLEFDPAGNITATAHYSYQIGNGNQLASRNGKSYRYNGFGDLVERPTPEGDESESQRLVYDEIHQLIRVETADGLVMAEYEYDALGRRVKKKTAAHEVQFLWEGEALFAEIDSKGTQEYVFQDYAPVARINGDGAQFYQTDHIGTPLQVTDESGRFIWAGRFDPYGKRLSSSGSVHQPFGLPGQYGDEENGLYYNLFRYYDPEDRRYITHDPIGLKGGYSLYHYASNPLSSIDPLGLIILRPVPYGSTDLMPAVDDLYHTPGSGARTGGDVAAVRYNVTNTAGETEAVERAFASGGGPHAEERLLAYLRENHIDPSAVEKIYTEIAPCFANDHECLRQLQDFFHEHPDAVVEFSFLYDKEGVMAKKWAARERLGCA
jgi:RHS repeat-associated protein